jgi:Histidine kinase-like ATPase domain
MMSSPRSRLLLDRVEVRAPGGGLVREHDLEPHLASPRRARVLLRHACLDWALGDTYDDAALVVTELVSNAVRHAGTPCRLTITLDADGLRLAVRDHGPLHPALLDAGNPRQCGAGLRVVTTLTQCWGVVPHLDGKTVWAQFPSRRPFGERHDGPDPCRH